jgi:hypothetical protein
MDPRLEAIFREETRRALGGERMTAERLMQTIIDFSATAPPEELAVFAYGIQRIAAGMAKGSAPASAHETTPEAATAAVSEAVVALAAFRSEKAAQEAPGSPTAVPSTDAPVAVVGPDGAPRRAAAAPFRVTYPARATMPRAVPPAPAEAPGPDPPSDDIEDFTASATAS